MGNVIVNNSQQLPNIKTPSKTHYAKATYPLTYSPI